MTRRIDRVHEARARDAQLDAATLLSKAERRTFVSDVVGQAEAAGDRLHAVLGLPADVRIVFDATPVAANDAATDIDEGRDRA